MSDVHLKGLLSKQQICLRQQLSESSLMSGGAGAENIGGDGAGWGPAVGSGNVASQWGDRALALM